MKSYTKHCTQHGLPMKEPMKRSAHTVVCVVPTSLSFVFVFVLSNATFSTTSASAMTSDMSKPNVAKNMSTQVRVVVGGGRMEPRRHQERQQLTMPIHKYGLRLRPQSG